MDIKIYFDVVHDDGKKRYLGQDEEANLSVEEKDSEIFKHLKSFKEAPSHQSLIYIFHHLIYKNEDLEINDEKLKYHRQFVDIVKNFVSQNYLSEEITYEIDIKEIEIDGKKIPETAKAALFEPDYIYSISAYFEDNIMVIKSGYSGGFEDVMKELKETPEWFPEPD